MSPNRRLPQWRRSRQARAAPDNDERRARDAKRFERNFFHSMI
jgi:ribosomal protein L39E